MERRKTVAIRTDTLEQWIVRSVTDMGSRFPCDVCGPTVWVTVGVAATATELTIQEICRFTANGRFHSTLGPGGGLLICASSLEMAK